MTPPIVEYFARVLPNLDESEAKELLYDLGWMYLDEGGFKTVFGKKGVPFVIKFCNIGTGYNCYDSQHYDCSSVTLDGRGIEEEMGCGGPFGLPPLDFGELADGTPYGIQERVRPLGLVRSPYKKNKPTAKWFHKLRDKFITAGHKDFCLQNVGVTDRGKIVQFD